MCGRYVLARPVEELVEVFGVDAVEVEWTPSYNVAPTRLVPVVAVATDPPLRKLAPFRWGLVPMWADSPAVGSRFVNARAEHLATSGAYRDAYARRRCLIPADGFYEWQGEAGTTRRPWYFTRADGSPIGLGGLFERWRGPDGAWLLSCTIITTEANHRVGEVHDRMPVIVQAGDFDAWLAREPLPSPLAERLLAPAPDELLVAHPVAPAVGNVANDGPELVAAVASD